PSELLSPPTANQNHGRTSTLCDLIPGRMSAIPMPNQSSDRIQLLQGTLDMLVLRTLLFGPAHGHQIAKHIQRTTEDLLQVEHGSLYPALHRLERKGWIAAKWEPAGKELKREFKYYRLTAAGRKQIVAELHGYAIMRQVEEQTGGRMRLGPGTLYSSIQALLEEKLIEEVDLREDEKLGLE